MLSAGASSALSEATTAGGQAGCIALMLRRKCAVRMVQEHHGEYPPEWAAITSIVDKLGVGTEALWLWLRRIEVDQCQRPGVTTAERERIRELEQENRARRRANEILKAASAFFARELDPRLPTR
ncbi:MAG: transposase [Dehalococcoidia bacterium]